MRGTSFNGGVVFWLPTEMAASMSVILDWSVLLWAWDDGDGSAWYRHDVDFRDQIVVKPRSGDDGGCGNDDVSCCGRRS